MANPTRGELVRELHSNLALRYRTHVTAIEAIWRSLDKDQQAACLEAGKKEEKKMLEYPVDRALGTVGEIANNINLLNDDLLDSELFLDILHWRSSSSLLDQYCSGFAGCSGDGDHTVTMLLSYGMTGCSLHFVTMFTNVSSWGETIQVFNCVDKKKLRDTIVGPLLAFYCLPTPIGDRILARQFNLLQSLMFIIDEILNLGSQIKLPDSRPQNSQKSSTRKTLPKLDLTEVLVSSSQLQDADQQCLDQLYTDPSCLASATADRFFTNPLIVPDHQGRRLPDLGIKYLSMSFFEVLHEAVRAATVWDSIHQLLTMLQDQETDKFLRALLLQELSNLSRWEYDRSRSLLRRQVQLKFGAEWFQRVPNASDAAGDPRVIMKGDPGDLTCVDPMLHYVLRLCQPEPDASKAAGWTEKLLDLARSHAMMRGRVNGPEAAALFHMTRTVNFIKRLTSAVALPTFSRKKGQAFVSKMKDLEAEMNEIKTQVDFVPGCGRQLCHRQSWRQYEMPLREPGHGWPVAPTKPAPRGQGQSPGGAGGATSDLSGIDSDPARGAGPSAPGEGKDAPVALICL
ncbi:hypothetical protein XA68_17158 [Ophiocordyceps unilateralis]|uniref:Uncharacterized protein n=1 Tax=Ophiocordyceps unilateralis TaxID=268505 RepID=A0A2A9PKE2_OPHUN|nr:hypothetical protein XA68_17158 [Ophiocordyceps unilateralis]